MSQKTKDFPPLSQMGRRICIIGPSNSGKSTLTHILAQKLDVPGIHLDQIRHIPGTDWQTRPLEEFIAAHDDAVKQDGWVMDGNYSSGLPQRLDRATGVIWIDPPLWGCMLRYLLRCFKGKHNRYGGLKGATREFSFGLIHYSVTQYPKKKPKYAALLAQRPHLPFVSVKSMKALNALYDQWGIKRPL